MCYFKLRPIFSRSVDICFIKKKLRNMLQYLCYSVNTGDERSPSIYGCALGALFSAVPSPGAGWSASITTCRLEGAVPAPSRAVVGALGSVAAARCPSGQSTAATGSPSWSWTEHFAGTRRFYSLRADWATTYYTAPDAWNACFFST